MSQEKRFGRRMTTPSKVEIIHELKLMALRQSLDAELAREAHLTAPARDSDSAALASASALSRSDAL